MPLHRPVSNYPVHSFPVDTIDLKCSRTGGYDECSILHLDKYASWRYLHVYWKNFRGPFVDGYVKDPSDDWVWPSLVRRFRKETEMVRCAAIVSSDDRVQGATIYRRNGASLFERGTDALYGEYLAASPFNRKDCAKYPNYAGVGEGLLTLLIAQSYIWDLGGRVSLFSLPKAVGFYEKFDFEKTGAREGDMIHMELRPEAAVNHLKNKGLIR